MDVEFYTRVLYYKRYENVKWDFFLSALSQVVVPFDVAVTIESARRSSWISLAETLMTYSYTEG